MKKYDEYTSTIHHRQAPFTHWYLFTIGVRQEHQGKGYSNHLMMPVIDYFDENCQSCYLETHNQRNVSCYEKYGFKIAEIGCLPGTQKTHWGMIRLPI